MKWLNDIVDQVLAKYPEGQILIESGGSPSGTYHIGHLRELIISDALMLEIRRRGRDAKHIYFSDDLDGLRKIPVNVPSDFDKYLGLPLCDVPAPDGPAKSYAEYFLTGLIDSCKILGIEVEFVQSHEKYRSGFFVPAIERCLDNVDKIRISLETISGRKLTEEWTPVQVLESGRLKNRKFLSIDTTAKKVEYADVDGRTQTAQYDKGEVKLDWRIDWPSRWWLLGVKAEPFGRDHASAGGSFDTGVQIMKDVYQADPPIPVPYDFINMAGDTKKMSGSKGTGLGAVDGAKIMPAEVLRYLILRVEPSKRLYFDPVNDVVQLMDEYAALVSKPDQTESEKQLIALCSRGVNGQVVSRVPFSHVVASYQAALKDPKKTLEIIERTEYADVAKEDAEVIEQELVFIDRWLEQQAPESIKFVLRTTVSVTEFSDQEQAFLKSLADKIIQAPLDADGTWFHTAIYELKDSVGLTTSEMFATLYKVLIGKANGPRAGWFLSILPRDWLIKRLRFEA